MERGDTIVRKIAVFLIFLIFSFSLQSFSIAQTAQSAVAVTIALDECLTKAVDISNQPELLDKQIKDLWEQENKMMETSNAIQQQLDMLERYKQLYKKWTTGGTMSPEDQYDLMIYQAMFGERPPEYTSQEIFDKYIRNRDFPHYSIWASAKNLEKNKELAIYTIKTGVKQIFDGIIDLQDALVVQQKLYENMSKQHNQMLLKYKAGLISEIDKYASETSLEKQKLIVDKLKRSLENSRMTLKRQLQIPLKQEISFKSYGNSINNSSELTYQDYLKKALESRAEVLTAKMDLQVKQREDDIMKQYISCEVVDERMEAIQALEDKKIAYTEAVNKVTADITYGFKDVKFKLANMNLSLTKFQSSDRSLKNAQLQYDKGMISLSMLWNVEIENMQAKLTYEKAVRDYNNAVYKLETACGIGPGYKSGMGGN